MTRKEMNLFLDEHGPRITATIKLMCHMYIDGSWDVKVNYTISGGSWCAVDVNKRSITIQIGIPEWIDEATPGRERYVQVLGYEPTDREIFTFFMDLAMHEFMHACITRAGNTIQQIAMTFPMRDPNPSKYKLEFYKQRVIQLVHFWFNAAEDARIENIGKNLYNVADYFDFGRIIDYMVATDAGNAPKSWIWGYAILQLGVIGKYPQFEVEPEGVKAIEAILHQPVPGSTKTKNLYDEFLCEPHPTISVKQFAKWFAIPEVHEYCAKLIYEEVETQCAMAEKLANMLANMPQEVRISGNGGGSGIPMQIPDGISIKRPGQPKESGDEENKSSSGGNGKKADGTKQDEESKNASGSGAGDEKKEKAGSADSSSSEGNKDSKDSSGNEEGKSSNSANSTDGNSAGEDGEGQDGSQSSDKNGESNATDSRAKPQESDTFDEDGNWQLNESNGQAEEREELAEDTELRSRLDETISGIAKAAKNVIVKKQPKPKKATKAAGKGSKAEIEIDTSFSPTKFAPTRVVQAAKPLRSVIRRLFSENQEDEIVGLKAGSLNTKALYRYKNKDLAIFKEHKLPTIVDAVYYICWDGSGSMYGDKQSQSAYACAVIEEAVRGIYPLKIINFSTHGNVVHYLVKDFDEKTKKNCAYSFGAQRSFSGGNKDGFSIRQCTEELIKRKETNKFLIVLSDGAPSDYNSHQEAVNDVKSAVAFARQNKIDVTSIFFGSQRERDAEIELYNEMYGAGHIISCDPCEIVNHMVNIVKKNILKR